MYNKNMARIGILGGAFDPPHKSHILIAQNALLELGLDKIVFLPSYNPPHKNLSASCEHRLNMLKLVSQNEKFEICEMEINGGFIGYTLTTLPKLREIFGEELIYIIGGDSMRDFYTWYKPEAILKQVELAVFSRDGENLDNYIERFDHCEKKGIKILKYKPPTMSSSDIRLKLELGISCCNEVDSNVLKYIFDNNLYNDYNDILKKLIDEIDISRYQHTISTCLYAVKLNKKLKLDSQKVIKASLLHDCAKCAKYSVGCNIPEDVQNTPVAHAFAGAFVAENIYGEKDCDVINAIKYHTTGRENMSKLEKLIFCADMLEETRDFYGADNLRILIEKDFEQGFLACLTQSYKHLLTNNEKIYPLTKKAYEFYNKGDLNGINGRTD